MVKTVTLDLNASYLTFIRRIFPNAEIIVDRFHIIQLVSRALDNARSKVLKTLDCHSRQYKSLKSLWRLYHKNENDLDATIPKYYQGLREYMTQQNMVDLGLDCDETFKNVYEAYQSITDAVYQKDTSTLEDFLNTYQKTNTEMDIAITTLRKYKKYMLNSTRYNYSNGPIEGLNRKIKALKRNCYGFRNQLNFFTRIQLILGKEKEQLV